MSLDANGPNAEQIGCWNDQLGPRWVEQQELLDAQIEPLGLSAMERAGVAAGERVIDVGCGCGQTLLALGARVGSTGSVLGVDVSAVMLARAEERVREAGLAHVRTLRADAQTHAFEPKGFDRVFSRFGVMFFADPVAAFANMARALAPGGSLTFVCWQALDRNPWLRVPVGAVGQHVALPPRPAPGAPGPFSFADETHVRGLLEEAGFRAVEHTALERELLIGGGAGPAEAAKFCVQMGPAALALRQAEERGERVDRQALIESVRAALEPFTKPSGVCLPSASWIVQARV